MEVLEPSPVDEQPESGEGDYFPPPRRSPTLGLQTHRPAFYLQRAQKYSSYTFTVFAAFHIANTGIIPLLSRSLDTSNQYLLLTRPYYQSWPLAEPFVVLLPLATHILSGVALRVYRRHVAYRHAGAETRTDKQQVAKRLGPRMSAQAMLGYLAIPLVFGHAAINRGLPLQVEGGSSGIGVDFVSHGIALAPVAGYVGFSVLVAVAATHMVQGWAYWLGLTPQQAKHEGSGAKVQVRRKRRQWLMNGLSASVVGVWLAGGLGVIGRAGKVESPAFVARLYEDIYKHVPLLDKLV